MNVGRAKIAMWASRMKWIDDSAKSKIDGRVAVANRTCPTVIVSVGTPYSHRSIKELRNGTSWVGKKGPAEKRPRHMWRSCGVASLRLANSEHVRRIEVSRILW